MHFSASDDLREQVRSATDIVSVIGTYLQLQPQGRNYVALCPWHDDARPSLQVNPERQSWKCWPCNEGGDVFSFVMKRENVDFLGALRQLADRAGIEWQPARATKVTPGGVDDKATLYKAMAWAAQQFHQCLHDAPEAKAARSYLRDRGINDESVRRYHIGYAPDEWQWLLDRARSQGFSPAVLDAVGLAVQNERGHYYDRFRGRVMFPISDTQRRAIAVGGRILPMLAKDDVAKYINSPETRLYTKSEQLYGLDVVRDAVVKSRHLMVMEGYTDVVISRQAGIDNVVAVCGTALGTGHLRLLKRFADHVTLILDGDAAGQKRAGEVLELFIAAQMDLRLVTLPDNLDPCDFVTTRGADAMRALVAEAPDALEYHVRQAVEGIDLANDTHRANVALQKILQTLSKAPRFQEDSKMSYRLREQQTLSRLSRMFRVDESLLRQQIKELRDKAKPHHQTQSSPSPRARLDGWERELFSLLIRTPDAISAVIENVSSTDLRTEPAKQLLAIYQDLELRGVVVGYQQVMDAVDDPAIQNILVELAEDADRKETDDTDLLLQDVLRAFHHRRQTREREQQLAELHSGRLREDEELDLLQRLIESKRHES